MKKTIAEKFVSLVTMFSMLISITGGAFAFPTIASAHPVGSTIGFSGTALSSTSIQLSWTSTSAASNPSLNEHDIRIWRCLGTNCVPIISGTPIFVSATNFLLIYPTGTYTDSGLASGQSYRYTIEEKHGGNVGSGTGATTGNIVLPPANTAPVAVDDVATTNEDIASTITKATLLANDTDANIGDTLSLTAVSNAVNGSVVISGSDVIFTPAANFNGTASFEYTVSDGNLTDIGLVTITVAPVNDAPVALNDSYSTNEEALLTISLPGILGNDTDVDLNSLIATFISGVANGILTFSVDGSFSYTPNLNFVGTDSFTYKANDGTIDGNIATVSILVSNTNDAPIAVADSYSTTEDVVLTVPASGVLGNDTDADSNPLTAVLVGVGTTNGGLVLNADGSFVYTPNTNFNGTDSFTYKANDASADSSVVTVTITVNPVNDAPVAQGQTTVAPNTISEDTNLSGFLVATDADIPANTLTYTITTGPTNGVLSAFDSATGAFTYTPNLNFNGSDDFFFTANDGTVNSDVAHVDIMITAVNDNPILTISGPNPVNLVVGDIFTQPTATSTDPDSANLPVITVEGTVNTSTPGTYPVTYTATSATGVTIVILNVIVGAVPVTPVAPTVTADDTTNTITGLNVTNMEYSSDNGVTWSQAPAPTFPGDVTVLVRVKGEGINPASLATTITFTTNPAPPQSGGGGGGGGSYIPLTTRGGISPAPTVTLSPTPTVLIPTATPDANTGAQGGQAIPQGLALATGIPVQEIDLEEALEIPEVTQAAAVGFLGGLFGSWWSWLWLILLLIAIYLAKRYYDDRKNK